jgi:hypothetical protein
VFRIHVIVPPGGNIRDLAAGRAKSSPVVLAVNA